MGETRRLVLNAVWALGPSYAPEIKAFVWRHGGWRPRLALVFGSIYVLLAAMEADGLITATLVPSPFERALPRRRYSAAGNC